MDLNEHARSNSRRDTPATWQHHFYDWTSLGFYRGLNFDLRKCAHNLFGSPEVLPTFLEPKLLDMFCIFPNVLGKVAFFGPHARHAFEVVLEMLADRSPILPTHSFGGFFGNTLVKHYALLLLPEKDLGMFRCS